MTVLYSPAYRFGAFVERRKSVLLSVAFLLIPLTALALSTLAPAFGYSLFSLFCHQIPERTFGALPLCARCFGLYLGFGLAGLVLPAIAVRFSRWVAIIGICVSLVLSLMGLAFTVFDGNHLRLFMGLFVGGGFALFIKSVLK